MTTNSFVASCGNVCETYLDLMQHNAECKECFFLDGTTAWTPKNDRDDIVIDTATRPTFDEDENK